jgi:phage tail-like protein
MALAGALGLHLDPAFGYNFLISLLDTSSGLALAASIAKAIAFDVALGGFSECTGLDMSLDIEEFREGGRNSEILIFPTRTRWGHITLKKGVGAGTGLWDWGYSFVEGKGKRRDGVIVLMTDLHLPNNLWYFRRGLPVKYSGPTMNATQNAVAIESIEIAHEGIYQVPYVGLGTAAVGGLINLAV